MLHSTEPLPSASLPNDDPRPTLVWFSGTWCHFCERMSSFAHTAASDFNDRLRFVEKSVDHDRDAASRYGVRGTPTFVLIDRQGRELTRFHYQPDATAFATQIEAGSARDPLTTSGWLALDTPEGPPDWVAPPMR